MQNDNNQPATPIQTQQPSQVPVTPNATPVQQAQQMPQNPPVSPVSPVQPMQPVRAQQAPKSHGWIIGIVAILAVLVLCLASMYSCRAATEGVLSSFSLADNSYSITTEDCVAVIDMSGTIQYDYSECSPEGLKYLLDEAENDMNIKAVVLRVDSGGGTATAGEEMAQYVRDFSKPIVVSSASTNASAAYEISSQADYIFTAKTSAIGAIGVALQITDLSGLYDMLGINIENIVSEESKDATYGTRPLTDEERAWYQAMVDQICEVFIQTVADGRDMTYDEVKELANGLIYTGIDAVENGLADEIGTLEDAVAKASELAGYENLPSSSLEMDSSNLESLLDFIGSYVGTTEKSDDSIAAIVEKIENHATN